MLGGDKNGWIEDGRVWGQGFKSGSHIETVETGDLKAPVKTGMK